jgi:tetratricopeptide (TPR) repeat protein
MELKLIPHNKNAHPIGGILIKGGNIAIWMAQLTRLQYSSSELQLFPVPDKIPNSIYGCVVMGAKPISQDLQSIEKLQIVAGKILIPEFSNIQPFLSNKEAAEIFGEHFHLMHPIIGLVELNDPLQIQNHIHPPSLQSYFARKPLKREVYPERILSFQVKPIAKEELFKAIEEKGSEETSSALKDKLDQGPLSMGEKLKLNALKLLFEKKDKTNSSSDSSDLTAVGKIFAKMGGLFGNTIDKMMDSFHQDLEDLEFRNKKKVDQLMDMLKNNPDEALKYAIPLDNGSTRGVSNGLLSLNERWSSMDLFGHSPGTRSGAGSGSVQLGDHYEKLRKQYTEMAQNFIRQKEYLKAAFVYMKLLKDYHNASRVLEENGLFSEAATIYLDYLKNKTKAAECYEKGKMFDDAIKLYKELNLFEKTGDLLVKVNRRDEANEYYKKETNIHISNGKHIVAANIFQYKMFDETGAKNCLLDGWRIPIDATNCLMAYLNFYDQKENFEKALSSLFKNELKPGNQNQYLNVLENSFSLRKYSIEIIREQAYQIIAANIDKDKKIARKLEFFNPNDHQIHKDTSRFLLEQLKHR